MRLEHIALPVLDPPAVAQWYTEHLGFTVKRRIDSPVPTRFLADTAGHVMLEVYNNPSVEVPNYAAMDPLSLHLALISDDVQADYDRLVGVGAESVQPPHRSEAGDHLAMLRDPWGLALQLCKRGRAMV
jgi:catechol 2,3-dioxygenase-like lactoylglutathione lyase family enzyme